MGFGPPAEKGPVHTFSQVQTPLTGQTNLTPAATPVELEASVVAPFQAAHSALVVSPPACNMGRHILLGTCPLTDADSGPASKHCRHRLHLCSGCHRHWRDTQTWKSAQTKLGRVWSPELPPRPWHCPYMTLATAYPFVWRAEGLIRNVMEILASDPPPKATSTQDRPLGSLNTQRGDDRVQEVERGPALSPLQEWPPPPPVRPAANIRHHAAVGSSFQQTHQAPAAFPQRGLWLSLQRPFCGDGAHLSTA